MDTTDFRKGLKIEVNGDPYLMIDFQHVKPGKGVAFVRTKIKNLLTGNVTEMTFRAGDKVSTPDLEEREMQYLYAEGEDDFLFMDQKNYEQISISREQLGDAVDSSRYFVTAGNHGSGIGDLGASERSQATATLRRWAGVSQREAPATWRSRREVLGPWLRVVR